MGQPLNSNGLVSLNELGDVKIDSIGSENLIPCTRTRIVTGSAEDEFIRSPNEWKKISTDIHSIVYCGNCLHEALYDSNGDIFESNFCPYCGEKLRKSNQQATENLMRELMLGKERDVLSGEFVERKRKESEEWVPYKPLSTYTCKGCGYIYHLNNDNLTEEDNRCPRCGCKIVRNNDLTEGD